MYAFPEMLDMTKVKFPSSAHRVVAEHILIGNGRYNTMSALTEAARIISKIPKTKIKLLTAKDLHSMGVMLP
jgi:hypothetical protein